MITVLSDESVTLSEFSLLCMKFSNNRVIENPLKFIEKLISKMFEFELSKAQVVDEKSIFNQMLNRFSSLSALITGSDVEKLKSLIHQNVKQELARVKEVRADSKNFIGSKSGTKIQLEILKLEEAYRQAIQEVAPGKDLKGLSNVEYCSMCIFFDSQPFTDDF